MLQVPTTKTIGAAPAAGEYSQPVHAIQGLIYPPLNQSTMMTPKPTVSMSDATKCLKMQHF
jgi:hypothetical protein